MRQSMRSTNHRCIAVAMVLATTLFPRPSLADDAPLANDKAAAPSATPPVLVEDPGAEYPAQAIADGLRAPATVTLELLVDAEGAVSSAQVVESAGHGFDEAAVAAALRLRFRPAMRGATPVAARIRHAYSFAPPPAVVRGVVTARETLATVSGAAVTVETDTGTKTVTSAADGTWVAGEVPAGKVHLTVRAPGFVAETVDLDASPAEEERVDVRLGHEKNHAEDDGAEPSGEVEVRADAPTHEVTRRTLEQRELARIPGTNGDAIRAIESMPGVARPPGLGGLLIVRGSAPQDTQVFLDGTPIPAAYHFGGLSSVIPTEMLSKIDFYPGNFGAEYGRAMGGIIDIGLRSPKSDAIHGMAQVDLIDARVMVEGPLGRGWTFSAAGRRSWLDAWLGPVLEHGGTTVTAAPVYYDYQGTIEKQFSPSSSFRVALVGSDDRFAMVDSSASSNDPGMSGTFADHTGFWRLQARFKSELPSGTSLALTAAVGQDVTGFTMGGNFMRITSWPVLARFEVGQRLAPGAKVNLGADGIYAWYDADVRFPPLPRGGQVPGGPFLSTPPLEAKAKGTNIRPGIYADMELEPWEGTRIVPGVRADYAQDTGSTDLAPRINVRQDLHTRFPRTTLKGGVGVYDQPPEPRQTNSVFGQAGLVSNRAVHADVGIEQELSRNAEISVEGFYKKLDHLVVDGLGNTGDGHAIGLEALLRYKPDEHFFGWIAYTLSRSEMRDSPTDAYRLSPYDQTHILTALGSYRLGRGWELGARFRLVSGNLYTPSAYGAYDETTGAYLASTQFPENGSRLPLFHQLDVRVDKTWTFRSWKLGAYLDLENAYNHAAAEGPTYNFNYTQQSYQTGLPIIPNIGLRGEL
jgi:TonB family protein